MSESTRELSDLRLGTLRLPEIDLLRGLAVVLMALDHVREFLHSEQISPLDLSQTTPALFLTRWITHFCAPVFIFLAGTGIALGTAENGSLFRQARFVLMRGIWLVVLELTIVHLGWFFNFAFHAAIGQVIWVIGWSMIFMSGLMLLPVRLTTAIGVLLIAGHNAFDGIPASNFGEFAWVWRFLHAPGTIAGYGFSIYIAYPLIPWVGVMAAGYGFGTFLRGDSPARRRVIAGLGWCLIALFAILRGGNLYGDSDPWTTQATPFRTLLDVLNCDKYPPSLAYLLMTLGPVLAAWPLWVRWKGPVAEFLILFGRVPLFFYVAHLFVIHGLTVAIVFAQVGSFPAWLWDFPPGHAGPGCGVGLATVYLIWLGVLLLLLAPVCRWYGRVKARSPRGVLRFL